MPPTDPSASSGEQVGTSSPGAGRTTGRPTGRRGLVPANVFFVRLNGRVAALLVGRDGQIRVQSHARERWRLVQVSATVRHSWSGRLTLRAADDALTVGVYGQHEADHLDLGNVHPRQAGTRWRVATWRIRRQAAGRLAELLGR